MSIAAQDRVKVIFSLFDANKNGYLTEDDFSAMASSMNRAAEGSDEAAKKALENAFARYWSTLRKELDADSDGRLSFAEFAACVMSTDKFGETVTDVSTAIAALCDPDGDGQVERSRLIDLITASGLDRPNTEAIFDALGPDGNDRVRTEIVAQGIKELYDPSKVGVAGDHLVTNGG